MRLSETLQHYQGSPLSSQLRPTPRERHAPRCVCKHLLLSMQVNIYTNTHPYINTYMYANMGKHTVCNINKQLGDKYKGKKWRKTPLLGEKGEEKKEEGVGVGKGERDRDKESLDHQVTQITDVRPAQVRVCAAHLHDLTASSYFTEQEDTTNNTGNNW